MTLPTRRWGPFRQVFYSFHSSPKMMEEDTEYTVGIWRNVWVAKLSNFVWKRWPKFWVWWMNLKFFS